MADVVVAGAGRTGMHLSAVLASRGLEVILVERLPEPGGQEPERDARELANRCREAGVNFRMGTMLVEYRHKVATTLGVDGAQRISAGVLALATGTRPATRAEMNIHGDRGAGMLPGSAALHFLESGILLGRNPVVIGSGQLAAKLCELFIAHGAHAVVSVSRAPRTVEWPSRVEQYDEACVTSVLGFPRLHTALVEVSGGVHVVPGDAFILADGRLPMLNIEGATYGGSGVIDCFSSMDPKTDADSRSTAMRAAKSIIAAVG